MAVNRASTSTSECSESPIFSSESSSIRTFCMCKSSKLGIRSLLLSDKIRREKEACSTLLEDRKKLRKTRGCLDKVNISQSILE